MKLRPTLTVLAPAMLVLAVAVNPAYAQDGAARSQDNDTRAQQSDARGQQQTEARGQQNDVRTQDNSARDAAAVDAQAKNTTRVATLNDGQILQVVRTLNDAEIKQAEEAMDEGESEAVKNLAEMIKTDHEASNEKMDALLDGELNMDDSPLNETLADQAEETHELLQDLAGAEYDCAYIQQQVTQHEAAIELSKTQLMPNAKSAGVKDYLTAKGPTLEHHLQMAKDALGKAGNCSNSNLSRQSEARQPQSQQ